MYLTLSLLASVAITLFVASKITRYFLAKRAEVKWVVLAFLGSTIIAVATYIGFSFMFAMIDHSAIESLTRLHPDIMLIITVSAMLLLSSIAFKIINQMDWKEAITTNIVSAVIMFAASSSFIALMDASDKTNIVTAKAPSSEQAVVKDNAIAKVVKP